ncbi:MAG: alpha/beta fold hydrolase [Candidatus Dormibacteraeota bacterium]|nr:alpha/beta fold hydrolase [Candidatus Dormibacteraeota bacterium]
MDPLPAAAAAGWEDHLLDRPQGPLRYVTAGTGPALVLCHGFIGSAENFESWVERLSRIRTLVIPDLPGFGASAPLRGSHRSRDLAREVRALLDHLGVGDFEAGGLCLGSTVALELAAGDLRRVRGLLLHTPLLAPGLTSPPFRAQVAALTMPGVFAAVGAVGHWRPLADLYRRVLVEGGGEIDERSAQVNFDNQLRANPRAAREWLRDGARLDFRLFLRRVPRPVAVLAAADDHLLRVDRLRDFCAPLAQVRLRLLPAAGHGWSPEFMIRQVAVLEELLA